MATNAQIAQSIVDNILSGNRSTTAAKVRTVLNLLNASFFNIDDNAGKGLSENDYTDAEKTKLSGVETGAQVNAAAKPFYLGSLDVSGATTLSELENTFDAIISISDLGTGAYRITSTEAIFTGTTILIFSINDRYSVAVTYTSTTQIDLLIYSGATGTPTANAFSDLRFKIEVL